MQKSAESLPDTGGGGDSVVHGSARCPLHELARNNCLSNPKFVRLKNSLFTKHTRAEFFA